MNVEEYLAEVRYRLSKEPSFGSLTEGNLFYLHAKTDVEKLLKIVAIYEMAINYLVECSDDQTFSKRSTLRFYNKMKSVVNKNSKVRVVGNEHIRK